MEPNKGIEARQVAFTFLATLPDYETALRAVREIAERSQTLTSDDVWALLDQFGGLVHVNAVGAAMNHAARRGILSATGRIAKSTRTKAHARNVQVWKSLVYQERKEG
jgi:hypothetical protein